MGFVIILIYIAFWIILGQRLTVEAFIIGIAVSWMVFQFNKDKFNKIKISKIKLFKKIKYLIWYLIVLVKEIVIANFHVAAVVLNPRVVLNPKVITFKTKLKGNMLRTILANSITLTPGTLTIKMEEDIFTVHCLKEEYIKDVIDSKFEKILMKVEE
ncbi:Na+/H+ antiporter subunit E [Clostridium sp. DL1XJH146]